MNKFALKLNEYDKIEICEKYQSGESPSYLGKIFNIDRHSVVRVLKIFGIKIRTISENHKGKCLSLEQRRQISKYRTGTHHSLKTKNKIALLEMGKNNPMFGKRPSNYIDGQGQKRKNLRRQRELGYEPLNDSFKDSHGHHINKVCVIYIPKGLHLSIPHSLKDSESMKRINQLAWDFLEASVL